MGRHLLIVGSGSAGKRHACNFHELGCDISCMDPREDRIEDVRKAGVDLKGGWNTLDRALDQSTKLAPSGGGFDGAVVASPPAFHVEQCIQCLEAGIPVFLEKPVSPDLAGARKLASVVERTGVPLLLGYTWRWWPSLKEVRELIGKGEIGRVLHVEFVMSAHLADWHPWEAYQDFFMARADLGGGALLDESHWIDQMLWFFGLPDSLDGSVGRLSDLEIDTDDNVDVTAHYPDRKVTLHLDLYGRPHEKSVTFRGTKGTLRWELDRYMLAETMEPEWRIVERPGERNHMFVEAAREFLEILDGSRRPSCTIADGVDVLRVVEAVRSGSESGQRMVLE